jgi:hypothetical protein
MTFSTIRDVRTASYKPLFDHRAVAATMTDPRDTPEEITPTVQCSRCGPTWDLSYELDQQHAGNQALEQFAVDHHRHTGHFPDDVTAWVVDCRHCPQQEQYLSERPARRFAETHARHTEHTLTLDGPDSDGEERVGDENPDS